MTSDIEQLDRWARIDTRPPRRRRSRPVSIVALRLAELNRIFTHRYGGDVITDDDAGRDDAEIVAHHLACAAGERSITHWLARRAPWMAPDEVMTLIQRATSSPRRWRADTLAKRLNLHEAERRQLRVTTIGAVDLNREQRAAGRLDRKRERDRLRTASRRRTVGSKLRADFIGQALTTKKPWVAEGISRRTWERRRALSQLRRPP